MRRFDALGPILFAGAMLLFGAQHLVYAPSSDPRVMGYPWIPVPHRLAYLVGTLLVLLALALFDRKRAGAAAVVLALLLVLRAGIAFVPMLVANVRNGAIWTTLCELVAMAGASLMAAGPAARSTRPAGKDRAQGLFPRVGRLLFALPLLVFAAQHFLYARYVATLVPAWIPGPHFWTLFTGAAFLAAGAALLSGRAARLAAILLGVMFGSWVLLVHLPRVVASPRNGYEWTSAFVALALCGGAWTAATLECAGPAP